MSLNYLTRYIDAGHPACHLAQKPGKMQWDFSLFFHTPKDHQLLRYQAWEGEWKIVWSASSKGGPMSEDIGYSQKKFEV